MILSVSRRTDIPSFYSDWFFNVLKKCEVLVPNPFIKDGKVARIQLLPVRVEKNLLGKTEVSGTIEGIVFWTKNPKPMLARINELKDFACYFQFTLNPYGKNFEENLPPLEERIETFKELSKHCMVVWRYDPIFVNKTITVEWHLNQFENIAKEVEGTTSVCMINTLIGKFSNMRCPSYDEVNKIAEGFLRIGKKYGIEIQTCAEIVNLEKFGIKHGKCIDSEIFEKMLNAKIKPNKKKGATRQGCHCMPCVDIGTYSTCKNGCVYCYADKGGQKSMTDKVDGEVYQRKVGLLFDYL